MLRRIQYLAPLLLLPVLAHAQTGNGYTQSNLISDGSVKAQQTDPNLINPWGVAIGQQTPFWINTAGTGLSEVYDSGPNRWIQLACELERYRIAKRSYLPVHSEFHYPDGRQCCQCDTDNIRHTQRSANGPVHRSPQGPLSK
jgi:hypothetical protein